MKSRICLSILFALMLIGCAAQQITIDEMKITDPKLYSRFKNENISVSTKDSIQVTIVNPQTQKAFSRKRILEDKVIAKYEFTRDSLLVQDPFFQTVIGFENIQEIKFKGVWDDELGFVSEETINSNVPKDFGKAVGGITLSLLTGFLGLYGGMALGLSSTNNWDTAGGLGLFLGAAGLWGGYKLGSSLVERKPPEINQVVSLIKAKQQQIISTQESK